MVIKVKLKRKLSYKGHFEYQFVNPLYVRESLRYLKEHSSWYSEIDTAEDCIHKDLDKENTSLDAKNEGTTEQYDSKQDLKAGVQYNTCL